MPILSTANCLTQVGQAQRWQQILLNSDAASPSDLAQALSEVPPEPSATLDSAVHGAVTFDTERSNLPLTMVSPHVTVFRGVVFPGMHRVERQHVTVLARSRYQPVFSPPSGRTVSVPASSWKLPAGSHPRPRRFPSRCARTAKVFTSRRGRHASGACSPRP